MVSSDRGAREIISPTDHLHDSRSRSFWDSEHEVGRWFDERVTRLGNKGENRIEWDAFFLYGPNSEWTTEGKPDLDRWGRTIHQARERLLEGVNDYAARLAERQR